MLQENEKGSSEEEEPKEEPNFFQKIGNILFFGCGNSKDTPTPGQPAKRSDK